MSAPDNERTFVPAELDALEDALEQSPAAELRFAAGLDDAARARVRSALIHYRAIEHHARGLLLEAAPPATLLADVIAQAHAAVAVAPAIPAESTWSRIKSRWLRPIWVVPSLAALGTAAVALFIVMTPQHEAEVASESAVVAQSAPEPTATKREMPALAEASELRAAPEEEQRGEGLLERKTAGIAADDAPHADGRTTRDVGARAESARRNEAPADPAPNRSKKSPSAGSGSAGPSAVPGGAPQPSTPPPAPKSVAKPDASERDDAAKNEPSAQQRLARADEARHRGDCDGARNDYEAVIASGTAKQKARARAGLALCLERAGDRAAADALIEQARRDDAAIDSYLDAQR